MGQKKYIFGYGSLVSAQDIERTLGHPPESLEQVTLTGWVRDWGIILNNSTTNRHYETLPERKVPSFVAILNIHKPRNGERETNPNGVLFPVTDQEMQKMDERESHYRRIEITEGLTYKPDGKVYTYVGLSKYLETPSLRLKTIVPKSYRELVEASFSSFGEESLARFRATTVSSNVPEIPTIHTSNV